MKKLFLFTLVFAYCLLAGSCKDDDSSADPPFTPQNYQFTKAYGVLHPSSSTGQPENLQLILSNTGGHSIEDYTGPGEYLSLYLIVADVAVSDQQILFPSGTYTLSEDPAKAMTVWKSAASFFYSFGCFQLQNVLYLDRGIRQYYRNGRQIFGKRSF